MDLLKSEYDWQYYRRKHYELIFTKFYQAQILPVKFNIDKRKAHYSALVHNGKINRSEAFAEIEKLLYNDMDLIQDKDYVTKKLGFINDEFGRMMQSPSVVRDFYPSNIKFANILIKIWYKHVIKISG